jgi:alternate signal-mediated exported protein
MADRTFYVGEKPRRVERSLPNAASNCTPQRLENNVGHIPCPPGGRHREMPRKDKIMNKYTKGAIATGAAIVLLLGGAGTFALWNDSADIAGGDIDSGTLELTNPGTGAWVDMSDLSTISNINNFRIVPGDVARYTQTFVIEASGTNLEATLDVDSADFIAAAVTAGFDPGDITVSVSVNAAPGSAEITSADDGLTKTVVVTITFDEDADNGSQNLTVDLTSLDITLNQHL